MSASIAEVDQRVVNMRNRVIEWLCSRAVGNLYDLSSMTLEELFTNGGCQFQGIIGGEGEENTKWIEIRFVVNTGRHLGQQAIRVQIT